MTPPNILEFIDLKPEYGTGYREGYIMGSFYNDSFVSKGIVYFTRNEQVLDIPISHVAGVASPDTVVESVAGKGVIETPLKDYFDNPHYHVFFRKPRRWTPELASQVVEMARTQLGKQYDDELIRAHLASSTLLGKLANYLSDGKAEEYLAGRMHDPDKWICSELWAWSMQQFKEWAGQGCLSKPAFCIDPAELFWDTALFERWKFGR